METSSTIRRLTRQLLKEKHSKCVNSAYERDRPSRKTIVSNHYVENYQIDSRIRNTFSVTTAFMLVAFTTVSLLLLSCNLVNSSSNDSGGVGIIIPGKSMDGIKLGDSKERVVELLGDPDKISHVLGFVRSWRGYHYLPSGENEGSGLMVLFKLEEGNSLGPVDVLRVSNPYDGQTPEGIRIGSTLNEVRAAYGEPDYFSESELKNGKIQGLSIYCINSKTFEFNSLEGVVGGIIIYHYYPMEFSLIDFSCQ